MKKRIIICIAISMLTTLLTAQDLTKSDAWNRFRGPNGSGVSENSGLPTEFGSEKNVIWKRDLPTGYSSPVLSANYIFLTAVDDEKLYTYCISRNNGETIWRTEAPRPRREKLDNRNNAASPSIVLDNRMVYSFFGDFGLLAYDYEGNEKWRLALGPFNNDYGIGASPILVDNIIVLVVDQTTNSFIIAINKSNGEVIWKKSRSEAKTGHSTPILYQPKNANKQILVPGSFMLIAYSVDTGERIWWTGGLSFEMKSTPVIYKDMLFINGYATPLNQPENQVDIPYFKDALSKYDVDNNGFIIKTELPKEPVYSFFDFVDLEKDGVLDESDWNFFKAATSSLNGMLGIKLGGNGDMTDTNIIWQYHKSIPQLPSPLVYQDVLYMVNDGGFVTSFNPETGDIIERGRISGGGTSFYASPVASDNKIYITSRKGKVSVLKSGGKLDVININDMGEECYATPALVDGKIYLRTVNSLYCFGN